MMVIIMKSMMIMMMDTEILWPGADSLRAESAGLFV